MTTSETSSSGYLPGMLNPFEPGYFDNPYAQYAAVREQDPVHLSPIGVLMLFRYQDVYRVLRDPSLSVEVGNANLGPPSEDPELAAAAYVQILRYGSMTKVQVNNLGQFLRAEMDKAPQSTSLLLTWAEYLQLTGSNAAAVKVYRDVIANRK